VQHRKLFEEDREFNQGAQCAHTSLYNRAKRKAASDGSCLAPAADLSPCRTPQKAAVAQEHSEGMHPAECQAGSRAGEFAEALRDQFMVEHAAYYLELEEALMEKNGFEADCTREQLAAALVQLDPDLLDKQVWRRLGPIDHSSM
jgi:hypothetical protein